MTATVPIGIQLLLVVLTTYLYQSINCCESIMDYWHDDSDNKVLARWIIHNNIMGQLTIPNGNFDNKEGKNNRKISVSSYQ